MCVVVRDEPPHLFVMERRGGDKSAHALKAHKHNVDKQKISLVNFAVSDISCISLDKYVENCNLWLCGP